MDFVNYCSNKSASGLSISGSERRSKESSSPCKRLDRQKSVSYSYYTGKSTHLFLKTIEFIGILMKFIKNNLKF